MKQRLTFAGVAIALLAGTLGFWVGRLSSPGPHAQIAESPPPSGGITKARAVRVALSNMQGRSVLLAAVRPIGEVVEQLGDIPPDTLVWVVVLEGTFPPGSCGAFSLAATPHPCPPPAHTAVVFVEYKTGRALMEEIPATPYLSLRAR
jgi:hypothetical protein